MENLVMGFFYGVIVVELLICIIKMFIDARDMKKETDLFENVLDMHLKETMILSDMADRLNVLENKVGITHEDTDEEENKNEEEK